MNEVMKTIVEFGGKVTKRAKRMRLIGGILLILSIALIPLSLIYLQEEMQMIFSFMFAYLFFLVGFVLLIIGASWLGQIKKDKKNGYHNSLDHFSPEEIDQINRQVGYSTAIYYKRLQFCLTDDYLLCGNLQLDIICYKDIKRVYISKKGVGIYTVNQLAVETRDGNTHFFNHQRLYRKEQIRVLEKLIEKAPEAIYGAPKSIPDLSASLARTKDAGQVLMAKAFYAGRIHELYTNDPDVEGNIGLGIVGAFMGSLLIAIAWVVICLLGFICGWIGYFMLRSAMKGYRLFSKKLDRTGAMISIMIAAIMIFLANWFSLSLTFVLYGDVSLSDAVVNLFFYLDWIGETSSFWINLAMGYGLSALLCAGTIKDVLCSE